MFVRHHCFLALINILSFVRAFLSPSVEINGLTPFEIRSKAVYLFIASAEREPPVLLGRIKKSYIMKPYSLPGIVQILSVTNKQGSLFLVLPDKN